MGRGMRRFVLPFACLAAAGLIGGAAVLDHHWKDVRSDRAQVAEWYCQHEGTRCGGPSSALIERHWNERQLGYEVAVLALGVAGLGFLAGTQTRRARH